MQKGVTQYYLYENDIFKYRMINLYSFKVVQPTKILKYSTQT